MFSRFVKSIGGRFFIIAFLTLIIGIPLIFVSVAVGQRERLSESTSREIGTQFGGKQGLLTPVLVVPFERDVLLQTKVTKGEETFFEEELSVDRTQALHIRPADMTLALAMTSQMRKRGIYEVPVYTAAANFDLKFTPEAHLDLLPEDARVMWEEAALYIGLTNASTIKGGTEFIVNGAPVPLQRKSGASAFFAKIGDPRNIDSLKALLNFTGAELVGLPKDAGNTQLLVTSDWPHPKFSGGALPTSHNITDAGFSAEWQLSGLSSNLAQASVSLRSKMTDFQIKRVYADLPGTNVELAVIGFEMPVDFYQKAHRFASYGILFIGLSFLTFFLLEIRSAHPVHPMSYILIGLAQVVFALLMVSLAEQIGFAPAYVVAAGATIALITSYAKIGLGLGRMSWVVLGALCLLYAIIYLILMSIDYALLSGSVLAFAAIGATMFGTAHMNLHAGSTDRATAKNPAPDQSS